jgi:hypothetical protein
MPLSQCPVSLTLTLTLSLSPSLSPSPSRTRCPCPRVPLEYPPAAHAAQSTDAAHAPYRVQAYGAQAGAGGALLRGLRVEGAAANGPSRRGSPPAPCTGRQYRRVQGAGGAQRAGGVLLRTGHRRVQAPAPSRLVSPTAGADAERSLRHSRRTAQQAQAQTHTTDADSSRPLPEEEARLGEGRGGGGC